MNQNCPDRSFVYFGNNAIKKLNQIGRFAYVVIGGLHHIDPQESAIREAIWELMPHHFAQIKILCSIDLNSNSLPSMDGG